MEVNPPGLELATGPSELPEVYCSSHAVGVSSHSERLEPQLPLSCGDVEKQPRTCSIRRRECVLLVAVVLLVITSVVIGTVLGTRKHSSAVTVPSASPTLGPIRDRSSLAVTGYKTGQDFNIKLFYQGDDGYIRLSSFNSTTGRWQDPSKLVLANAETPLGASFYERGGTSLIDFQVELFYSDEANVVREWNDGPEAISANGNGSLSELGWKIGVSSKLTAYWPDIYYQDDSNSLGEILFSQSEASLWLREGLGVHGLNASGLLAVPQWQNFSSHSLYFQRDDQKLVQYNWYDVGGYWSFGSVLDVIPPGAALGGFATPRGDGTNVNVFILWQDPSTDILVKWMDDKSGWKGPMTYSALKGADNGTSIACLTPIVAKSELLVDSPDMCRCYFQVNQSLREVSYSDYEWKVIGNVPI